MEGFLVSEFDRLWGVKTCHLLSKFLVRKVFGLSKDLDVGLLGE
jgi:hypothetical protein